MTREMKAVDCLSRTSSLIRFPAIDEERGSVECGVAFCGHISQTAKNPVDIPDQSPNMTFSSR